MANPKRRHSHARKSKRRANDALDVPPLSLCSNCGSPKLPHRVCTECGHYKGRQVAEGSED
ncbi:MAG: 50S ribosomal protein L32 [Acidobacteria bacterium]|nr:50S ribosomal protein L32 [Acidobacteriota bacterium]MCG2814683.1 50S ribosomal protein L32 [Candidatus Aminicenantes bacterium]MBU1475174.1 50S ribosomal protein L32 [Acidobacteriota bacterium]MBU2438654.1 50S ribosomal protein L32 [Acidobacteriota bacterium]MBU4204108.1 50S ribosomal protein L32 [Acidobacteriota bacterium]